MTRHRLVARIAPIALLLSALGLLAAIGSLGAYEIARENAQAHALVTQGNVTLARGDRASAVLSFERARLLAPRSDFVRSALSAADIPPTRPSVEAVVGWITPRDWSWLAIGLGWMSGLSFAARVAWRRSQPWIRRLAIGSAAAFVISVGGLVESTVSSRSLAVVTAPTGALIAPYDTSGATADLHAGDVVRVGDRHGDFVRVRGADGADGWVVSRALRCVVGGA